MTNKTTLSTLIFVLFFSLYGKSQNDYPHGKVKVDYFTIKDYNATAQNWDCAQDENGFLYFANNSTGLTYDGERWNKIKLDNDAECKSVEVGADNTVYFGGVNQFGKVVYNEIGKPIFKSLKDEFDKSRKFSEFWYTQLNKNNDDIFFISKNEIIIYNPQENTYNEIPVFDDLEFEKFASNGYKHILSVGSQELKNKKDFYELKNNKLEKLKFIPETPKDSLINNIIGIFEYQQKSYLALTEKKGVYLIKPSSKPNEYNVKSLNEIGLFKTKNGTDYKVSCAAYQNGVFAFGLSGGSTDAIYIFDEKGKFKRKFGENDGLLNLEVHSMFFDKDGNLWSVNDNGLAKVELSSPITSFSKEQGLFASIEDLEFLNDQLYIAARGDLLTTNIKEDQSMEIVGTGLINEETYDIEKIRINGKSELFIVGLNGLYAVNDKLEKRNLNDVLAWKIFQAKPNDKTVYIGQDNAGLGRMIYQGGQWIYKGVFKNSEGNVRNLDMLNDTLFYSVTKKGVVFLDTTLTIDKKTLTISNENLEKHEYFVERFQDDLFVGTQSGLYIKKGKQLVPFDILDGYFSSTDKQIFRLKNTNDQKLWVELIKEVGEVEHFSIGFLEKHDGKYTWTETPFKELTQDVIKTFIEDKDGIFWFGAENKLYTYNPKAQNKVDQNFKVFVTEFSILPDSIIGYNLTNIDSDFYNEIDFDNNSIKVSVAAPVYYGKDQTKYRFKLEGYDDDWSNYSERAEISYQKLPEGNYTLHVQAINYYGVESEIREVKFVILPPWYRTWWAYTLYVLLAILLIYAVIRLSIKRVKQQNERLEKIVDERTAEIANKNHELEHQKVEIEEKNKDIMDSIKYAQRIQNTILPSKERLRSKFNDFFVYFKPKDIVSGDFYWSVEKNNKLLFSAVDCTGHGVPGAFVSIVGSTNLNRCVNEFNLQHPNEILDKLRDLVIEAFAQEGNVDVKDGMDLALCSIDFETGILEYAGANNPLYIVRKGEILETKADKQPIGAFAKMSPFTNHVIQLEKGDCVYIFSDGYVDQFGGPKGKKFKSKSFKQMLVEIYDAPMQEQKTILDKTIKEWQGEIEQVDDICIFGVRY